MTQREHEVASLNDFPIGHMRQVEIEETKILMVREKDAVHAIGAVCPHAGGPLAEGSRRGDRLVCPWHKATFCIRTGALLEPPAVDPLPRFKVRIDERRVLVTLPSEEPPSAIPAADRRSFVIVGAGAAGAVAAQTLREIGFGGRIIMLDRENRVPYDRTVLSKYYLSGEVGAEKSPLQTQSYYRQHKIERRTAEVVHVDEQQHRICCADGSSLHYDAALLATGATPRQAPIPGADLGNVFLLRSRADADAILAQAERSERAVIIGASFIGMEVAASLRERGLEVTVAAKESVPFEKQLGAQIGSAFVALHERHGVRFRLGQTITKLDGDLVVREVVLENCERLPTDLVVVGFGVKPTTSYARHLPLNKDGSIKVDAHLRIVDSLYAAGDVAAFPYRGKGDLIRVEHWRVAEQQGRVAALSMAGQDALYDAVPVFWTIQYLKRLDYIGHAPRWDDIVIHGDLQKPEFLAYYVKDGFVCAAIGFDKDRETSALVELFNAVGPGGQRSLAKNPLPCLRAIVTPG